jgi:hypothetical protein
MSTTHPSPRSDQPERLREDVERARAQLGETVAALAAKADLKARAKNATRQMKADLADQARSVVQNGKHKVVGQTREKAVAARQTATSQDASRLARGGAAAGVAAGAASAAVWMRRRRVARRASRWQRTMWTAQQTGAQVREKAADIAAAFKDSDLAARTVQTTAQAQTAATKAGSRARQAAGSPVALSSGAVPVTAAVLLVTAWWLHRRRRARAGQPYGTDGSPD